MSVYVGMDVHRKRSQVAVIDDRGVQQRNRNLANDPATLVPIFGVLPGASGPARGWSAHGHDRGRRDRRYPPLPSARMLCAWAGLTPQGRNLRPHGPPRPHHQTGLTVGTGDPAGGRPDRQAPPHVRRRLRPIGPPSRQPHRHRGDRRRLLARCFHILTQLEAQKASEKADTGRARVLHEPATRPPGLTEQPGSGLHRRADPCRGPNGCM